MGCKKYLKIDNKKVVVGCVALKTVNSYTVNNARVKKKKNKE